MGFNTVRQSYSQQVPHASDKSALADVFDLRKCRGRRSGADQPDTALSEDMDCDAQSTDSQEDATSTRTTRSRAAKKPS